MVGSEFGVIIFSILLVIFAFILTLYCVNRHIKIKRGVKEKPKSIGFVIPFLIALMLICIFIVVMCAISMSSGI